MKERNQQDMGETTRGRETRSRATLRKEWSHVLYAAHGIQEYRAFASMLISMNAEEKTPAA